MRGRATLLGALVALASLGPGTFGPTWAQAPLSAIDWLDEVTSAPIVPPPGAFDEPAVTRGVVSDTITVTPLDGPSPDAVGLLPRAVSGLPADLWGPTPEAELIALIEEIDASDLLPATRSLLYALLLAELAPPKAGGAPGRFLLARVDTLTRLGAIESAQALLERAGPDTPERFQRWFDLSLLLGTEGPACDALLLAPGLGRSLAERVFCLARSGDWAAAALSFETGAALGQFDPLAEELLLRFLDPELAEAADGPLPPPDRPSALVFHLFETLGEPLPTTTLPLAFAHADLRPNTGWKAQVEAAERLARVGALPANKLLGLYTERQPAASGGVWTRVDAVQTFDRALAAGSEAATGRALPIVWDEMRQAGLAPVFAELYGAPLHEKALAAGPPDGLAFRVALLSDRYEQAAQGVAASGAQETFLAALARGALAGVARPNERAAAIADGFAAGRAPGALQALIDDRALGAAILRGILLMADGAQGDIGKLTEAIALFRALGLEDAARRAALQVLILDPHG